MLELALALVGKVAQAIILKAGKAAQAVIILKAGKVAQAIILKAGKAVQVAFMSTITAMVDGKEAIQQPQDIAAIILLLAISITTTIPTANTIMMDKMVLAFTLT
jgi:hypothetical protein